MNEKKYLEVYVEVFGISEEEAVKLKYQGIKAWDSVGHMSLVAVLEEKFEIMLDTDDIIAFSSYDIGKEILRRYDVEI